MPPRGPVLLSALWVAAAVTATSVGLLAVHLVGNEVGGQVAAPLDDEGVQQALGSVSPTPSHSEEPAEEQPATPAAEGRVRTVVTEGGVVSARCSESRPRLLYATPAEGFRTERESRTVTFVGARSRVLLTMRCSGEELQTTATTQRVGSRGPTPTPTPVVQPSPTEAPEPSDRPDQTGNNTDLGGSDSADGH